MENTLDNGELTLYAKFKNDDGVSDVVFDNVLLHASAPQQVLGERIVACPLDSGNAYTFVGTHAIYYVMDDCTKFVFTNEEQYFSYFESWDDVIDVHENILESIPTKNANTFVWGPRRMFGDGELIKTRMQSHVYLIEQERKHWISSANVFLGMGFQWSMVHDVVEEVMGNFDDGDPVYAGSIVTQ